MIKPLLMTAVATFACLASAASVAGAPQDSSAASDETVIYETFLNHWLGNDHSPILISEVATPPEGQDVKEYAECAGKAGFNNVQWRVSTSKRNLREILGNLHYVHFVEPKKWHPRDPGALIAKGQSVGEAVNAGMAHALMSFSTITFDKEHRLAALSYSSVCGSLCGTGGEMLFVKTTSGWVSSPQRCSGWMS